MRHRPLLLLAPALVLAVGPSAWANCPSITPVVKSVQPTGAQTGVPLNGVVNFGIDPDFGLYSPALTLTTGGMSVTSGFLISGPGGLWTFRPNGSLTPNTLYNYLITDLSGVGAPVSGTFTTGTASDVTFPGTVGTPSLVIDGYTPPSHDPTCDAPGYYVIKVGWSPAVSDTPVVYALSIRVVDLNPNNQGDMTVLPQGVTAVTTTAYFAVPPYSGVGVSVYAINETGRETNSNIGTVNVPDAPLYDRSSSCGCDLSRDRVTFTPLFLGVIGLVLVRLRRRR